MLFPEALASRTQDHALQCFASRDKPPERDQQLACQRDDHRLARAYTAIGSAGLVPLRQCALFLKPQEPPGELDHAAADPGVAGLWQGLVPVAWRRSRPASPSGRRSAPPLCGHALAARAPHGPAYLPFRRRLRRPEPGAVPWRVARSRAPAPIVSDEPPRSP